MQNQAEAHKNHVTFSEESTYEKVKRLVDFERGQKLNILDVGCGSGVLAEFLQSLGHQVTGLDINPAARQKINFVEADINLPWPVEKNYYDLIICTDIAEHLYDPANILEQAKQVLTSSGKIIFGVPNHFDLRQRLSMLFGKGIVHWGNHRHEQKAQNYVHIRFFTLPELLLMFEQNSFPVQIMQFNFMGAGIVPTRFTPKWLRQFLVTLWPNLFSGKFIFLLSQEEQKTPKKIIIPNTPKGI